MSRSDTTGVRRPSTTEAGGAFEERVSHHTFDLLDDYDVLAGGNIARGHRGVVTLELRPGTSRAAAQLATSEGFLELLWPSGKDLRGAVLVISADIDPASWKEGQVACLWMQITQGGEKGPRGTGGGLEAAVPSSGTPLRLVMIVSFV